QFVVLYPEGCVSFCLDVNHPEEFKHPGEHVLTISGNDQSRLLRSACVKKDLVFRKEKNVVFDGERLKNIGDGRIREVLYFIEAVSIRPHLPKTFRTYPKNFTGPIAVQPIDCA